MSNGTPLQVIERDLDIFVVVILMQEVQIDSLRAILVRKIDNTPQSLMDKSPVFFHPDETDQKLITLYQGNEHKQKWNHRSKSQFCSCYQGWSGV